MTEDSTCADLCVFITREDGELVTDSRAVAIAFGKQHKNVLRIIERKRRSRRPLIAEHNRLNFQPVDFIDAKGERRPMYRMTAMGMAELAMGFNGELACETRIRFLQAFKEVADRLQRRESEIARMCREVELRDASNRTEGRLSSRLSAKRKRLS